MLRKFKLRFGKGTLTQKWSLNGPTVMYKINKIKSVIE